MGARHPLPYAFAKANTVLLEDDGSTLTLWAPPEVGWATLSEVQRLYAVDRLESEAAPSLAERINAAARLHGLTYGRLINGLAKAGIDPQKVIEITSVGGARTGAMETRGPRMIRRDFSPHFSANNMYKDLSGALKVAEEAGVSLPAASISREMLRVVKTQGKGDMDSCIVMTVIEAMANTVVKATA